MNDIYNPAPGSRQAIEDACDHEWNQSAGEADENFLSGEGSDRVYCMKCGADGDA